MFEIYTVCSHLKYSEGPPDPIQLIRELDDPWRAALLLVRNRASTVGPQNGKKMPLKILAKLTLSEYGWVGVDTV
jgi:hypothetical protein